MGQEINYAQQFEDTFHLLAQTRGEKLSPFMRNEEYTNAESVYYEQMFAITEDERTERFGRTQYKSIGTARRKLTVEDKVIAIQIDTPDENRTLADIRNPNIQQISHAWKRSKDVTGIRAALGTTKGGQNGEIDYAFDFANQVIADAAVGMTVDKLIAAKQKFWDNDIDTDNPMYQLHLAINGAGLANLLSDAQGRTTSSDFAQVKALVNGEIDYFMGYKFHRTELLPYFTTTALTGVTLDWLEDPTYGYVKPVNPGDDHRACFAWAQDTVCVGTNQRYKFRAEELAEYNYNFGLFAEWSIGGMRQEEKTVVAIACDESP